MYAINLIKNKGNYCFTEEKYVCPVVKPPVCCTAVHLWSHQCAVQLYPSSGLIMSREYPIFSLLSSHFPSSLGTQCSASSTDVNRKFGNNIDIWVYCIASICKIYLMLYRFLMILSESLPWDTDISYMWRIGANCQTVCFYLSL